MRVLALIVNALLAMILRRPRYVWLVVYGNYCPSEVTAIFGTRAKAHAFASKSNETNEGMAWEVEKWRVRR